mmetsp:Transcript_89041/g.171335  ORF Transcript_89041/g.171335 Transcript_89041/m.171335 type:complete len:363 (+) Transcript_89041:96-1184(+)
MLPLSLLEELQNTPDGSGSPVGAGAAACGDLERALPQRVELPAAALGWGAVGQEWLSYQQFPLQQPWNAGITAGFECTVALQPPYTVAEPPMQLPENQEEPQHQQHQQQQQQLEKQLGCLDELAIRFPPGLLPPPGTPSHGSMLHGTGICRPCAWFWKARGCQNGPECGHCHLCPEGELKARKKAKQTILRLGLATPKAAVLGVTEAGQALRAAPRDAAEHYGRISDATGSSTTAGSASDREEDAPGGNHGGEPTGSGSGSEQEEESAALPSFKMIRTVTEPPQTRLPPPQIAQLPPGVPSLGSLRHDSGGCSPCAWFWKPSGCCNAANCGFCHSCPEGAIKARKKGKRQAVLAQTVAATSP